MARQDPALAMAGQLADVLPRAELERLVVLQTDKRFRLVAADGGLAVCQDSPISEASPEALVATLLTLARVGHMCCIAAAHDGLMSDAAKTVRAALRPSALKARP